MYRSPIRLKDVLDRSSASHLLDHIDGALASCTYVVSADFASGPNALMAYAGTSASFPWPFSSLPTVLTSSQREKICHFQPAPSEDLQRASAPSER